MAKTLKAILLGGVGEIGKNITALEYGDSIIIIDAGLSFPTEETPGVDIVIPDFSYLKSNAAKVKAIFLTHGHEDHVGAVPYLLSTIKAPVYGTAMTLAIAALKLEEFKIEAELVEVEPGDTAQAGPFSVEFIKVCHSVPGATALSIKTPQGIVFFTGDYKIDFTPVDGKLTDLARIADIGKEGVLAMFADSTNVEKRGHSQSETEVCAGLESVFLEYPEKRLIITTFSSHTYRIQQIINLAVKYKRKVVLSGKSMQKMVDTAKRLGELDAPAKIFIEQGDMKNYADGKLVVISAGSQGEPMSALTRMANNEYSKVKIRENDIIVMSSSAIPGNKRLIYNVVNNLYKLGAEVIYDAVDNMHASGHAFREEMKLMITLLKPRFFIPVHGEYRHLVKHAALAKQAGVPPENVLIGEIGSVFGFNNYSCRRLDNVTAGSVFVDGNGPDGLSLDTIIRDRRSLSSGGIIILFANLSDGGKLNSLDIIPRGFTVTEEFEREMKREAEASLQKLTFEEGTDISDV
ncbi:MAG TPA: ribonuclease J, partial [Eubacteriales bacterium]|nr:ribonuclease J [Eubacteriales bacterium]